MRKEDVEEEKEEENLFIVRGKQRTLYALLCLKRCRTLQHNTQHCNVKNNNKKNTVRTAVVEASHSCAR